MGIMTPDEIRNRIFCGDSAEMLKTYPDESVDLFVSSPPYDSARTYKGFRFDFMSIAKEMARVLKPGGVIVWVVNDETVNGSETLTSFKQAIFFNQKCGLNMHDTMIWHKTYLKFPDDKRYYSGFEYMFVLSKGVPKTINLLKDRRNIWKGAIVGGTERTKDGTFRGKSCAGQEVKEWGVRFNVWAYANTHDKEWSMHDLKEHPAVFPEELARDHILSWSKEGDVVADCFAGSGTTLIQAKRLNRFYTGIDISPEYCKFIEKRLKTVGLMQPNSVVK